MKQPKVTVNDIDIDDDIDFLTHNQLNLVSSQNPNINDSQVK